MLLPVSSAIPHGLNSHLVDQENEAPAVEVVCQKCETSWVTYPSAEQTIRMCDICDGKNDADFGLCERRIWENTGFINLI